MALKGVDNVHGCDGLSFGVLGVGNSVPDDILQEDFEDTTGFFVDQAGDALHSTTAGQTTDGGLGDALDVVAENFAMAFGTS